MNRGNHQVLVLTPDLVDRRRFEQLVLRVTRTVVVVEPKLPGKFPIGMPAR